MFLEMLVVYTSMHLKMTNSNMQVCYPMSSHISNTIMLFILFTRNYIFHLSCWLPLLPILESQTPSCIKLECLISKLFLLMRVNEIMNQETLFIHNLQKNHCQHPSWIHLFFRGHLTMLPLLFLDHSSTLSLKRPPSYSCLARNEAERIQVALLPFKMETTLIIPLDTLLRTSMNKAAPRNQLSSHLVGCRLLSPHQDTAL